MDFEDLKAFSNPKMKEIFYTATRPESWVIVYGVEMSDEGKLGPFLRAEARKLPHLIVTSQSLKEAAKTYASHFHGDVIHLSSGRSELRAEALANAFEGIVRPESRYFISYGESGTLGVTLKDLSEGDLKQVRGERLKRPYYFEVNARGFLNITKPQEAGVGAWQRRYEARFAFSRAA